MTSREDRTPRPPKPLDALAIAAKRHPEQRLGQLIENALYAQHGIPREDCCIFNLTDADLAAALTAYAYARQAAA